MKIVLLCLLFLFLLLPLTVDAQEPLSDIRSGHTENAYCWRWENMMTGDLEEALDNVPVAYLVVSPLEWHGDAMAFGTDPKIGTEIGEMAWRSTGGVLIPTLYIGSETEYKDWTSTGLTSYWGMEWNTREHNPGSLYISNMTFELVMRDMLASVQKNGFKACVIVTGHGATEYIRILKSLEKQAMEGPMKVIFSNLVSIDRPPETLYPGSGGHADFAEASNLTAVDPTMVDKNKFGKSERDRKVGIVDKNVSLIDEKNGNSYLNWRADRIIETVNKFMENLDQ